jgi:MerC mercury resistance protein
MTGSQSRYDRRGIAIAALCFVHCVAGPFLLSFAGLSSLLNISEKFDLLFLCGSAAMGALALVPAYRTKHRRASCLMLFAAGVLCLLLRRHVAWRAISIEPVAAATGAILIISAHVLNLRFSKQCGCCHPLADTKSNRVSPVTLPERNS